MRDETRFAHLLTAGMMAVVLFSGCDGEAAPEASEAAAPPVDHKTQIEEWRANRDARLRKPDGWLSLVGLHWLAPGENRCGSGADNEVRFPEGRVADRVGTFVLDGESVTLRTEPGVEVLLDGQPVGDAPLAPDNPGPPDVLELDELKFYVIKRADRFGIRVKDPRSEVLASFDGMDYYPIDTAWRIEGTFVPWDKPREVPVPTVTGGVQTMYSPGMVEFEVDGQQHDLMPLVYELDDEDYFYIFKDETNGSETYSAGRFLYSPRAEGDRATIDFNKAYNPPCVFTPYATCPLPPPGNHLAVRVEAGEKDFGHH